MLIENEFSCSNVMALIMFTLIVTIYEKFAKPYQTRSLTLKMEVKLTEENKLDLHHSNADAWIYIGDVLF